MDVSAAPAHPLRTVTLSAAPVVTIYVRHSADCPHKDAGEFFRRCKCRKSLRWRETQRGESGRAERVQQRRAARTRSWSIAEQEKRKVENELASLATSDGVDGTVQLQEPLKTTTANAVSLFMSSKRSQGITSDVLGKYKRELNRLQSFMEKRSRFTPQEISLEDLTVYRAGWDDLYPSSTTRAKVQERLRSFLRFCYESRLMDRVPRLSPIRVDEPPTMPLTESQYGALLNACKRFPSPKAERAHALVQLMRYSGLAIRDAVTLERLELEYDGTKGLHRVTTKRQKTGTHVSVPIPPRVADEVKGAMLLNASPLYAFWNTGTGKPQTAVTNWQHVLREAFRAAGQADGHPHQLRDTFAVSMLEKGVPLEEVSKLLGHESIKTTEKYYAKWVKTRQDRLDTLVAATWAVERPQAEESPCPLCGGNRARPVWS